MYTAKSSRFDSRTLCIPYAVNEQSSDHKVSLDMSYPTKIAFPTPPPTTNALTSQQRSQLLRTTQKLGRLLGTTPALIEESDSMPSMLPLNLQRLAVPLHIQLSSTYDDDDALVRYPSSDTSGSERGSLKRNSSVSSGYSSNSGRSSPSTQSVHVNESWPKADRPFLRIATKRSSKLAAIPQSPPPGASPPPSYTYSPEPAHTSFTIRPIPVSRAYTAPPPPPAFAIPSNNSMRRQKMDRLRRTLGDGVPLDMVFPEEETHAVLSYSSASSEEDLPRTARSPPPPHRIRAARDSLLVPHPATPRRFSTGPQPARAAPPPPPMVPVPTTRELKKLSIIAEREEPFARPSTDSERYMGDTETDFAQRHRRSSRMYEGGDRRVKRVPVPMA
ncbi:hypothetical protein C8R47DRAFT_1032392 [Mycena vitilis]|nr:hypothetical protein C8R47DRAFT_1032392 [Mycena vitilis]